MIKIEFDEYNELYNANKDSLVLHSCWTTTTSGHMTAWGFKDDNDDVEPFLKSEFSMPMDKLWAKDGHNDEALKVWGEARKDPANWKYWKRDAQRNAQARAMDSGA